ncbi:MAG TPA: hypothetical protein VM638_09230 [Actinomycetota bacterium]|nr:hypothetical protein [Actinomycetota bacterium]
MTFLRAEPPAVVIILALEEPARVLIKSENDGEKARLLDWINTHDELLALVHQARTLAEKETTR